MLHPCRWDQIFASKFKDGMSISRLFTTDSNRIFTSWLNEKENVASVLLTEYLHPDLKKKKKKMSIWHH